MEKLDNFEHNKYIEKKPQIININNYYTYKQNSVDQNYNLKNSSKEQRHLYDKKENVVRKANNIINNNFASEQIKNRNEANTKINKSKQLIKTNRNNRFDKFVNNNMKKKKDIRGEAINLGKKKNRIY